MFEPNTSLILLPIDELADTARKVNHKEADIFEELIKQAKRLQTKLDISNLCLSVLVGKDADAIGKAITKCMKENKSESKRELNDVPTMSIEGQSETTTSPQ